MKSFLSLVNSEGHVVLLENDSGPKAAGGGVGHTWVSGKSKSGSPLADQQGFHRVPQASGGPSSFGPGPSRLVSEQVEPRSSDMESKSQTFGLVDHPTGTAWPSLAPVGTPQS